MRVPRVIADAIPVGSDLVWVNERTVQCITKSQYLVSNKDNGSTTEGTSIYRCTLRNRNVGFWLIICRERGDSTILAREFEEAPIRAGTECVGMVIDFIHANITGVSCLWMLSLRTGSATRA